MQAIDAGDSDDKNGEANIHNLLIINEVVASYSSSSALQLQFHLMGNLASGWLARLS